MDRIPVRVIDSRSLTVGLGLIVIEAADLAAEGADLDQVADLVEALVPHMNVYGVVDTLEHLEKGGRIGGARALLGSLLSIKPVRPWSTGSSKRSRSSGPGAGRSAIWPTRSAAGPPIRRLAVANGAAQDIDDFLAMLDGVESEFPLVVSDLGPVVGTHSGPGTVGVCILPVV